MVFHCPMDECTEAENKIREVERHLDKEHNIQKMLERCPDCNGDDENCYICGGKGLRDSGRQ